MKRFFAGAALFSAAIGFAAMPMLSHAAGPVTGSCTKASPSPYPKPQPDAMKTTMPSAVDSKGVGWIWHDSGNTKAQVGSTGSHGWITADVDSTNKKASVKGYSYDKQQGYGNLNGQLDVSQSNVYACYGVNNQKVVGPTYTTGSCTAATPRPKPPAGSSTTPPIAADPSATWWAWHDGANSKAQVGGAGGHGWIVGNTDSTAQSASVKGYSTDQGNVNGDLQANKTAPSACAGANGQKIKVS